MILLLLLACPGLKEGPDDTAGGANGGEDTSGEDSGDTGRDGLADATASFVGAPSDAAGSSVLGPGDLDGDGAADAVVGAYYGGRLCWFRGPIAPGRHDLDAADGCLVGEGLYDFAAYTIAAAGDVDGDGTDDMLVGAVGNGEMGANAGKVYVVAGPPDAGEVSLATSYATWVGEAGADYAGIGLAAGGDLTGDEVPDLLVGASGNDGGGAGGGKAYLLPGPILPGAWLLSDVETTFVGAASPSSKLAHGSLGGGDLVGDALAGPGDLNGDGLDDLALGAGGNGTNGTTSGLAAIWWGPIGAGSYGLAEADQLWYGPEAGAYAGSPLVAGGDLDGDGRPDLLVAADGLGAGTIFVVPGGGGGATHTLSEAAIQFVGETIGDQAGAAVVAPGDIIGDDAADVAIGAPAWDGVGPDVGRVHLYAGPFVAGTYTVLDAAEILAGERDSDNAGRALAGTLDLTGDGLRDLLVGASYNDEGGAFAGKVYLIDGR